VLNHVAKSACAIIKTGTTFKTYGFRNSDLNMVDGFGVPQMFKHAICKTQCEEVLNSLFAQVMVNTENGIFFKVSSNLAVNFFRRFSIVAQWLFYDDPCFVGNQTGIIKVLAADTEH